MLAEKLQRLQGRHPLEVFSRIRHQLAQLHICLMPFDEFSEVNQMLFRVEDGLKTDFEKPDECIIVHLPLQR